MKPVERDLRTYYTRRTHINIFIVSARLVPYVMWITHEHLYTIYLKEKKIDVRDILQSYVFFSSPTFFATPLISSPFSRSKCRTIPTHPCAAIESPSLSLSIFSLSSFPPAFRLSFSSSSSTAIARTHVSSSFTLCAVHLRRLPVFLRATYTLKSRSHVHSGLYIRWYSVISEHFHILVSKWKYRTK